MPTYVIASDLVAGFQDKYYARAKWRWSIGLEWTKMESLPLRIGYSWAGADLKELSMGIGYRKGPIIWDLGFAFRNGSGGRVIAHVDTYSTYTTSALRIMVSGAQNVGNVGLTTVNPNKVNIAIFGDT